MKIVERKFTLDETGWWVCARLWDDVQGRPLSSAFEIPDGVKTIWLSLHDRSSSNRCSANVWQGDWGVYPKIEFGDGYGFSDESLDKVLKPFVGKKLHLQCEYMA